MQRKRIVKKIKPPIQEGRKRGGATVIRPPETYQLENGYIGIVENPGAVAENDAALAMLAKWWLQIAIDKGDIPELKGVVLK